MFYFLLLLLIYFQSQQKRSKLQRWNNYKKIFYLTAKNVHKPGTVKASHSSPRHHGQLPQQQQSNQPAQQQNQLQKQQQQQQQQTNQILQQKQQLLQQQLASSQQVRSQQQQQPLMPGGSGIQQQQQPLLNRNINEQMIRLELQKLQKERDRLTREQEENARKVSRFEPLLLSSRMVRSLALHDHLSIPCCAFEMMHLMRQLPSERR